MFSSTIFHKSYILLLIRLGEEKLIQGLTSKKKVKNEVQKKVKNEVKKKTKKYEIKNHCRQSGLEGIKEHHEIYNRVKTLLPLAVFERDFFSAKLSGRFSGSETKVTDL